MTRSKVLIIEDDRALADLLAYNLKQGGFETTVAREGADGLRQAQLRLPEFAIVDFTLPVLHGTEVCLRLRSDPVTKDMLIIMLTELPDEANQILGLSVGADEYLTKPFNIKLLLERIKALDARRKENMNGSEVVSCHGVTLNRRSHIVSAGNKQLRLTPNEYRLLEVLIRQPGRAFSRSELVGAALGGDALVLERTIDVHVRSLRKKLGPFAEVIETVRSIGYRFRNP
jgi:two-component system phosphate regulon response regulator PhoB